MPALKTDPIASVEAISRITAVPTILDVVCKTTGMGFAAVARVTEDRWIACGVRDDIAFGLKPGGELKIETTICNEIREHHNAVIIDNVAEDPLFANHHTPALYGLQSYISMPILLSDGTFFGTLCAIDKVPRQLNTPETIGMFKLFADLIAFHLDTHERMSETEAALKSERQETELREQFIAVLGHDLRNPLAAIDAGARSLLRTPLDEKATMIVGHVQKSIQRMSVLIDNVLDFARGRLGGGIPMQKHAGIDLRGTLEQVITELRASHPDCAIEADIDDVAVTCDPGRIGQLFSNLLANAITHGSREKPVSVRAFASPTTFTLEIGNSGEQIPSEHLPNLFKPFVRSDGRANQHGLGLGLYIASEIAREHDGSLTVVSTPEETRFSFSMPLC